MLNINNIHIISGSSLKIIAMITMAIDHTAAIIPLFHEHPMLYFVMRTIGRVAFIIFAFLLVEGFIHTHNRKKYGRNLFVFAFISQLPFSLIHNYMHISSHTNIGFTLLLAFFGMFALEHYKKEKVKLFVILATIILVTILIKPDYRFKGIGLIWVFYILRSCNISKYFVGFCMIARNIPIGQITGFALLSLYNGQRGFIKGPIGKYSLYAFYPLHLFLLWVIRTLYFA